MSISNARTPIAGVRAYYFVSLPPSNYGPGRGVHLSELRSIGGSIAPTSDPRVSQSLKYITSPEAVQTSWPRHSFTPFPKCSSQIRSMNRWERAHSSPGWSVCMSSSRQSGVNFDLRRHRLGTLLHELLQRRERNIKGTRRLLHLDGVSLRIAQHQSRERFLHGIRRCL